MKKYLRMIAMLLVLLMTVSLVVACNDRGNKDDDPKETERETERETEPQPEEELSKEEIEQLKSEMSNAILEALGKYDQTTDQSTEENTTKPGESTTSYGGVVEDLLGSLGGLGGGDYNYAEIIGDVLDEYIGSSTTSEFVKGLIKIWIELEMEKEKQTGDAQDTEEESADTEIPENNDQAIREFIARKTAEAVADAIIERVDGKFDSMVHDAIYESVYSAMLGNEGFMNGILEENIPGYKELGDLLGGFMQ